jgi:hypothetical protein
MTRRAGKSDPNMRFWFHAVSILFFVLSSFAAESIRPAEFKQLHSIIKPKSVEEKWVRIPWRTSLWEAREQAARDGKPILLWEMDGHPLGCT